jgi:hypothetical protein
VAGLLILVVCKVRAASFFFMVKESIKKDSSIHEDEGSTYSRNGGNLCSW